jgi:hypothetical protein
MRPAVFQQIPAKEKLKGRKATSALKAREIIEL